jgi:hypothetical protein
MILINGKYHGCNPTIKLTGHFSNDLFVNGNTITYPSEQLGLTVIRPRLFMDHDSVQSVRKFVDCGQGQCRRGRRAVSSRHVHVVVNWVIIMASGECVPVTFGYG